MPVVSMPRLSNKVSAWGATAAAGWVPADAAVMPIDLAKPSAICDLQELPTHTNKMFMVGRLL